MAQFDAASPVVEFSLTGNPFTDSLFDPQAYFRNQWSTVVNGKTSITYSFPWANGVASRFITDYGAEPNATATGAVTTAEASGIALAFQRWADVANITFAKVNETAQGQVGDIRIAFSSQVSGGFWGYTKIVSDGYNNTLGDIWIAPAHKGESFAEKEYNFTAIMHEIGHALGLDHPFEGNIIPSGYDNQRYTIMSYTDPDNVYYYNQSTGKYEYLITTPMVYDIAAIQHIYGANTSFHAGNDTYSYDPTKPFFATIWDAGGNDTIDVSAFSQTCRIDLRDGHYSTLGFSVTNLTDNLGIAFNAFIENAKGGSGNDVLIGNALANTISGNAGNDTLDGGAGADVLRGGAGDDTYVLDNAGDKAVELVGGGTDTVLSSTSRTLLANVENLSLSGAATVGKGNALNNVITGSSNNDTLMGLGGNDTLLGNGGIDNLTGGAGRDMLTGGLGADRFIFANGDFAGNSDTTCDAILDFHHSEGDRIRLALVDANTLNGTGDDAFTYIGSADFSHKAGELRWFANGINHYDVQGDTNGDGLADFWIAVTSTTALVKGDFVL